MRLTLRKGRWWAGDSRLSEAEATILFAVMFRPKVPSSEVLEWFWPDPDLEPEEAEATMSVRLLILNRKLRASGLKLSRDYARHLQLSSAAEIADCKMQRRAAREPSPRSAFWDAARIAWVESCRAAGKTDRQIGAMVGKSRAAVYAALWYAKKRSVVATASRRRAA